MEPDDQTVPVNPDTLREEVKTRYREVASTPNGDYHFHTGRPLTQRLGYDQDLVSRLPDRAVESFAGVANPFYQRQLPVGSTVVDAGSGAGFDCFVAANQVGETGAVIGVDMLSEMVGKASETARQLDASHVSFHQGLLEDMPVPTEWADAVISNGAINLCADKATVLAEIWRVLKPGGWLQMADIANSKPVPEAAISNVDLWTA